MLLKGCGALQIYDSCAKECDRSRRSRSRSARMGEKVVKVKYLMVFLAPAVGACF